MHIGLTMFPTDYSIQPTDLAMEAEARDFELLWLPEHTHIPTSRKSPWPGGAELPKYYYDTYDPFLSLAAAAAVTKKIKLATGICLVVERDPIHTAKEVSTVDRLSAGRFIFGIGGGWNAEEMANHGTDFATRFKLMRERIEAMKAIWAQSKAKYSGEFVKIDEMMQWPKPIQKPHPADRCRRRLSARREARNRLWRRLDTDRRPLRSARCAAAVPPDGEGRRPRPRLAVLRCIRRTAGSGSAEALSRRRRRPRHIHAAVEITRRGAANARPVRGAGERALSAGPANQRREAAAAASSEATASRTRISLRAP